MRLIVTRPEPEASRTAARLRDLGHEPVLAPVLVLERKDYQLPGDPPQGLIATSPNTIRFLSPSDIWKLSSLPLYHTGEKIAAMARAKGFGKTVHLGDTVEQLAKAFAAREPEGGLYLYLTGEARTLELGQLLTDGRRRVEVVEVYRAAAAAQLPLAAQDALSGGAGVLLYSRRSAQLFLTLARKRKDAPGVEAASFFVLSAPIADVVRQALPRASVRVAAEATEAALLELLPEGDRAR